MAAGRFSVEAVFKAVDRVTAPVSRMQNRIGKMTRATGRNLDRLNRKMNKFGGAAKKAAIGVGVAAAIAIGAYADVVRTGAEYQQSLITAAAKFPGEIRKGTDAYLALDAAARKSGSTSEFTASQSAQAFTFMAMAGMTAEASIAALPLVVDLATAANMDLAEATDIVTDSMGAFSMESKTAEDVQKNLARVSDVLSMTTNKTNTSVAALFEAIKEGGPVAVKAGGDIETFSALAGTLANAGIKGSSAGTTLKNMFLSLAATTPKADKALAAIGVTAVDSDGNLRDMIDIIGDMNLGLKDLGTADRSRVLKDIFGKIPVAGVNVLLAAGAKNLGEFRTELEGAAGSTGKLASVIRDSVLGRLNALNSSIEGVKLSIFSMNEGPLAEVITQMTEWVRANEELIASSIGEFMAMLFNNMEDIVSAGRKFIKVAAWVSGLVIVLKGLVVVMTAVNLVTSAHPAVRIVLGILLIIGVVVSLLKYLWDLAGGLEGIKEKAATVWGYLVSGFINVSDWAVMAAGAVVGAWDGTVDFFKGLWDDVTWIFDAALGQITAGIDKVSGLANTAMGVASKVGGFFGIGGGGEEDTTTPRPYSGQMVNPGDLWGRNVEERNTTNTSEITIRDETGRAEVTSGNPGRGLILQNSGAF